MSFSSRPRFFSAPPTGRRITACFSYMQRIGKGARTRLWLPDDFPAENVEWAAARQFDLLQEAGNLSIDDLEVGEIKRSFQAWGKMRAGGYSVAVLTLGHYAPGADDLDRLDQKIQDEITRMIHFLYLADASESLNKARKTAFGEDRWNLKKSMPHVAMALNERGLFKPKTQRLAEETFFAILEKLPRNRILHDTAVGLALPDASKEKNWIYIAKGEHRAAAFFAALGETLGEAIHAQHMRGYGDRITPAHRARFYDCAVAA